MKTPEAREYFRTLGRLYREAASVSTDDGKRFIDDEKADPQSQYSAALHTLRLTNDNYFFGGFSKIYQAV